MAVRSSRFLQVLGCFSLMILAGCMREPPRVYPPSIEADRVGRLTVLQYDRDGDGSISEKELDKCLGIKHRIQAYDTNQDAKLSAGEIAHRVREWQETKVGIMSVLGQVRMDGQPLDGAVVELIPEEFLSAHLKMASGTTNNSGYFNLAIDESDLPQDQKGLTGAQVGIYKVSITHPSSSIPKKYNSATNLGIEVAQDNPEMRELVFNITSQ